MASGAGVSTSGTSTKIFGRNGTANSTKAVLPALSQTRLWKVKWCGSAEGAAAFHHEPANDGAAEDQGGFHDRGNYQQARIGMVGDRNDHP
jgi:hypothetical protein